MFMHEKLKSRDNVFKLMDKIKSYDLYVRKYVINDIPKIHNDIRIHIFDELFEPVKNVKLSSLTKGNIQIKNLINTLLNISVLDYLFDLLLELNLCSKDKALKSLSKLADIKNIVYSWYNKVNEEK